MRERNIGVNVHYIPIYRFSYYQEHFHSNPSDFLVTEEVFSKIVTLPLFPKMKNDEEVRFVIENTKYIINECKKWNMRK
jgi:dTDP-4-amino-4,6-dideoxygalactose transaminase